MWGRVWYAATRIHLESRHSEWTKTERRSFTLSPSAFVPYTFMLCDFKSVSSDAHTFSIPFVRMHSNSVHNTHADCIVCTLTPGQIYKVWHDPKVYTAHDIDVQTTSQRRNSFVVCIYMQYEVSLGSSVFLVIPLCVHDISIARSVGFFQLHSIIFSLFAVDSVGAGPLCVQRNYKLRPSVCLSVLLHQRGGFNGFALVACVCDNQPMTLSK